MMRSPSLNSACASTPTLGSATTAVGADGPAAGGLWPQPANASSKHASAPSRKVCPLPNPLPQTGEGTGLPVPTPSPVCGRGSGRGQALREVTLARGPGRGQALRAATLLVTPDLFD